jgi:hypothetical protein
MKWVMKINLEFNPPFQDNPSNYFSRFNTLEENLPRLSIRADHRKENSIRDLFKWSQTTVEWSDPNDGLKTLNTFIKFVSDLQEGSQWDIKNRADLFDDLEGLKALFEKAIKSGVQYKLTREEIREKEVWDYVGAFIGKIVNFIIGIGILWLAFYFLSK